MSRQVRELLGKMCIGWVLIRVVLPCNCLHVGSTMSLASGLVFGGLLTYGAARLSANSKDILFAFGERVKCTLSGQFTPLFLVAIPDVQNFYQKSTGPSYHQMSVSMHQKLSFVEQ